MSLRKRIGFSAASILAIAIGASGALASEPELKIDSGRFEPATLTVPANTPVQLKVTNAGTAPIEFESFELNRERVVPPGQVVTVFLPSLDAGTYHFFDDFHRGNGEGTLIAK